MSHEVGVGLVGFGFAGRTFHAPVITSVPGLRLLAVVSSRAAEVRANLPDVAVLQRLDDLLADDRIALAVVATPNATHFELTRRALQAGRHVVVDKPFTVTTAEALTLTEEARRRARLLSVFHNRRWDADFLTVQRLLAEAVLGDVVCFESRYDRFRPEVRDRWRERAEPGSGTWFDLGAHLADQALRLFGPPVALFADLARQRSGAQATDYFHVLLRYPGSLRVVLHGSSLAAAGGRQMIVHGTRGTCITTGPDPQEEALKRGERPGGTDWGDDPACARVTMVEHGVAAERLVEPQRGDYAEYYRRVRDALVTGAPNPVPADEATRVVAILELAVRSDERREEMAFDDPHVV